MKKALAKIGEGIALGLGALLVFEFFTGWSSSWLTRVMMGLAMSITCTVVLFQNEKVAQAKDVTQADADDKADF